MIELNCAQCQDRAAELAMSVLEGRERAETLAHLQRCVSCQTSVAALNMTVTRLVDLLPEIEPPDGFAERVLAALATPEPATIPSQRSRNGLGVSRQRVPLAAAVLTVAMLTGAGVYAAATPHPRTSTQTYAAAAQPAADMMTAPLISEQHQIGTAYISPRNPPVIFVAMSEDDPATATAPADSTVTCDLVRQDGTTVTLGSFPLHNGHAAWVDHPTIDPHTLAGATLTTYYGHTLGSAHFTYSNTQPATTPTGHPHDEDKDSKHKDSQDKHSQDKPKDKHSEDKPKDKNSEDKDSKNRGRGHDVGGRCLAVGAGGAPC